MNLDDLKTVWKEEISYSVQMEDLSMTAIMNDVTRTKREVRFRDFWMIFALSVGALLSVLFGWLAQEQVDWLTRLGIIAFVVGTAAVCVTLIRARSVARSDDWTLRSRIEMRQQQLEEWRRAALELGMIAAEMVVQRQLEAGQFPLDAIIREMVVSCSAGAEIHVHLEGNFPGGQVDLTDRFALRGGRIARLEIVPNEATR